jgi:hypothetical protein
LAEGHIHPHALGDDASSIPNILLIELDAASNQHRPELVLKRFGSMVLFLIANVGLRFVTIGWADGKHAVATLPIELFVSRTEGFHKFGRFAFGLLDEFNRCPQFAHVEQEMDVVGNSADDDPWGIETADDRGQVGMDARTDVGIEKRLTVLCAFGV